MILHALQITINGFFVVFSSFMPAFVDCLCTVTKVKKAKLEPVLLGGVS